MSVHTEFLAGLVTKIIEVNGVEKKRYKKLDFIGSITSVEDDANGVLRLTFAGSGGGATDHGALTGLSDDDHPQYPLKTGATLTGTYTWTGGNVAVQSGTVSATNIQRGTGSPDGSVSGNKGDIYQRTDDSGQIYRNTDGGTTWVELTADSYVLRASGDPSGSVSADAGILYEDSSSGATYRNTDGGTTWERIYGTLSSDDPANAGGTPGSGSGTSGAPIDHVHDLGVYSGTVASATNIDITGIAGDYCQVTGTTSIETLGTASITVGTIRHTLFAASLSLVHSSSLILPKSANITTQAGDYATWRYEGSGNWRMVQYHREGVVLDSAGSSSQFLAQDGEYYSISVSSGDNAIAPVLALSDSNIAALSGLETVVDDIALDTDSYRVLLTAQSTASQNGVWEVHSGSWTRPTDFPNGGNAASVFVFVQQGTVYADQGWLCITDSPNDVIDTNNLAWVQVTAKDTVTIQNVGGGAGIWRDRAASVDSLRSIEGTNGIVDTVNGNVVEVDGTALIPRAGGSSRAATGEVYFGNNALRDVGYNAITPTAIAAQADDWAPSSVDGSDIIGATLTGSQAVTGLVAPTSTGTRRKLIVNLDTADTLTLQNESSSSTAANRFRCPNGKAYQLQPGASVFLQYVSSRWQVVASDLPFNVVRTVADFPAASSNIRTLTSGVWFCLPNTSLDLTSDKLLVPSGAVVTMWINGSFITSNHATATVEVQNGGILLPQGGGSFYTTHATAPAYLTAQGLPVIQDIYIRRATFASGVTLATPYEMQCEQISFTGSANSTIELTACRFNKLTVAGSGVNVKVDGGAYRASTPEVAMIQVGAGVTAGDIHIDNVRGLACDQLLLTGAGSTIATLIATNNTNTNSGDPAIQIASSGLASGGTAFISGGELPGGISGLGVLDPGVWIGPVGDGSGGFLPMTPPRHGTPYEFLSSGAGTDAAVSTGKCQFLSSGAAPAAATSIVFDDVDKRGQNTATYWMAAKSGFIVLRGNSSGTVHAWQYTEAVDLSGTAFRLPVTYSNGTGSYTANEIVLVEIVPIALNPVVDSVSFETQSLPAAVTGQTIVSRSSSGPGTEYSLVVPGGDVFSVHSDAVIPGGLTDTATQHRRRVRKQYKFITTTTPTTFFTLSYPGWGIEVDGHTGPVNIRGKVTMGACTGSTASKGCEVTFVAYWDSSAGGMDLIQQTTLGSGLTLADEGTEMSCTVSGLDVAYDVVIEAEILVADDPGA